MNRRTVLIAAFALYGCATPVTHDTASGRPEATFAKPLDQTHSIILNALVNRGYQITKDSPNLVVADRPSTNVAANVMLGSNWNPTINARLSVTLLPITPTQTRVVIDMNAVTNPGTGMERLTPGNSSQDSNLIQNWLSGLAA